MIRFFSLLRFKIFAFGDNPGRRKVLDNSDIRPKVSKTELEKIYTIVQNRLMDHCIFSKHSLSLEEFSSQIKICSYKTSLAINRIGKQNFKNLLNEYRVNAAIELLKNSNYGHYTIDAIAMEVGFTNRMSFCKAFKKITAKSPHAFRIEYSKQFDFKEN